MRDLVCQGHDTLSVTFLISGSGYARVMIFLFCRVLGQVSQIKTLQHCNRD